MALILSFCAMIGRRAPLVLALSLPVGVLLPEAISRSLLPFLPHIIVGLITVAMIRVDLTRVLSHLGRPAGLCISLVLLMVLMPLAVNYLAEFWVFSLPIHTALVFMACAPPLGSAPNLAYLLRLDAELVFNITIVGTLILPFVAPLIVGATLGHEIDFDSGALFLRLFATVGASVFLAICLRKLLGRERIKEHGMTLDGVSALIMVLFVVAAMGGVSRMLESDPLQVLYLLAIVLCANFGAQMVFSLLGVGFEKISPGVTRQQSLSFAMVAGNRNLGLFAAAIPLANLEPLLPFLALYQVPIYLTPLVGGLFYRYLLRCPVPVKPSKD